MNRVGIDLGTTNTVAALADRGNFPVVELGHNGEARLAMPSIVAWNDGELRFGWDAQEVWDEPGWRVLGSPKRWLGVPEPEILGGPGAGARLEAILEGFLRHVLEQLRACPHVDGGDVQAVVGVPANANSLQRLRTLAAARAAGLDVLSLMHEPTASAIEYANRHPGFGRGRDRRHVAVYDLGGGTFDASVVRADDDGFAVVRSGGVERLGGDDFDRVMADLALERVGVRWDDLSWSARFRLLHRCAEAKESIRPTTRKWLLDLEDAGGGEVAIGTGEYHEACQPLVEQTIRTLDEVLQASGVEPADIDALLLVGGGSQMPLVRRRLKEIFGTRLRISPHPFASAAVGLAVQAERASERPVEEKLARHFGVWREAEGGQRPVFDTIFDRDTPLPPPGERLVVTRAYRPAHNIGVFRFEECAELDAAAEAPAGHRTPWNEIRFPYDPAIGANDPLDAGLVHRTDRLGGLEVVESYECDDHGVLTVRIRRAAPALERAFLLHGPERVAPIARRRAAARG